MTTPKYMEPLYLGVDVGGTKILAAVATEDGRILARHRIPTPRPGSGVSAVIETIIGAIENALKEEGITREFVTAIGIGIPGVIDLSHGAVLVSPNMDIEGPVTAPISKHFGLPVSLGNDCNVAVLGERTFGAASGADNIVGMFVGTGIGGGIVCHGRLLEGAHGAAAEIGHMIMDFDGPRCGCGNQGCLESFASRTAIERELRAAMAAGRECALTEMITGKTNLIKSNALRKCLKEKDSLVTEVMTKAAAVIGTACINLHHIFDPELIVLGGGVIEACSSFMMPIIERTFFADPYMTNLTSCRIIEATLGDDVGVLGAIALARLGSDVCVTGSAVKQPIRYPVLQSPVSGTFMVDSDPFTSDLVVYSDGTVIKRKKNGAECSDYDRHIICAEEILKLLQGGPEVMVLGLGHKAKVALSEEASQLLAAKKIECLTAPTATAVTIFNQVTRRKAAIMHIDS